MVNIKIIILKTLGVLLLIFSVFGFAYDLSALDEKMFSFFGVVNNLLFAIGGVYIFKEYKLLSNMGIKYYIGVVSGYIGIIGLAMLLDGAFSMEIYSLLVNFVIFLGFSIFGIMCVKKY